MAQDPLITIVIISYKKTRTEFPPLLLQSKWDAFDNLLKFSLYERKLTQETR